MLDMFVQPVAGTADRKRTCSSWSAALQCPSPRPSLSMQPYCFASPPSAPLCTSGPICPTHCPCCCRTQAPPRTVAYAAPAAIAPPPLTVSAGAQIPYQNMVHGGPQTQGLQTQELQTQELQTQELQTQELQTQELQGTMQERSVQGQQLHSPHDEPEP